MLYAFLSLIQRRITNTDISMIIYNLVANLLDEIVRKLFLSEEHSISSQKAIDFSSFVLIVFVESM